MHRPRFYLASLTACCLALVLSGCGQDGESRATVQGTVRFRNQLLTSGTVVFVPNLDRGTSNELAIGTIKPDGTYQLQSDLGQGVAPGWYRVTIVAGFGPESTMRVALPEKYRDPGRSGLEREVQAGRVNNCNFALD
jgi:hypothetical protein